MARRKKLNPWHKHQKKYAGKGYSAAQIKRMYRKNHAEKEGGDPFVSLLVVGAVVIGLFGTLKAVTGG